jgi:microcystin-dependent protein
MVWKINIYKPASILLNLWVTSLVPEPVNQAGIKKFLSMLSRLHAVRQMLELFSEHGPSMLLTDHMRGTMPNFTKYMSQCEERLGSNLPMFVCMVCFSCARSLFANRDSHKAFLHDACSAEFAFHPTPDVIATVFGTASKKLRNPVLKPGCFNALSPKFDVIGTNLLPCNLSQLAGFCSGETLTGDPFQNFTADFEKKIASFPFDDVLEMLESKPQCSQMASDWSGTDSKTMGLLGFNVSNHPMPPADDLDVENGNTNTPVSASVCKQGPGRQDEHEGSAPESIVIDSYFRNLPYVLQEFTDIQDTIQSNFETIDPGGTPSLEVCLSAVVNFHQEQLIATNKVLESVRTSVFQSVDFTIESQEGNTSRQQTPEEGEEEDHCADKDSDTAFCASKEAEPQGESQSGNTSVETQEEEEEFLEADDTEMPSHTHNFFSDSQEGTTLCQTARLEENHSNTPAKTRHRAKKRERAVSGEKALADTTNHQVRAKGTKSCNKPNIQRTLVSPTIQATGIYFDMAAVDSDEQDDDESDGSADDEYSKNSFMASSVDEEVKSKNPFTDSSSSSSTDCDDTSVLFQKKRRLRKWRHGLFEDDKTLIADSKISQSEN